MRTRRKRLTLGFFRVIISRNSTRYAAFFFLEAATN